MLINGLQNKLQNGLQKWIVGKYDEYEKTRNIT